MGDTIDEAQERAEEFRARSLAYCREAASAGGTPESDDCIDCGEAIPALRRQALPRAVRCLGCQTRREGRVTGA